MSTSKIPDPGERQALSGLDSVASSVTHAKEWLSRALREDDTHPIALFSEPVKPIQIKWLFEESKASTRDIFRAALAAAIQEWRPSQGYTVLRDLSAITAYVRAATVIPHLRVLARSEAFHRRAPDQAVDTLAVIVGVVAGFAPLREVEEFLLALFFSERTNPMLAAQLLNGLCTCSPSQFPRYVPRFFALLDQCPPSHHRLDLFVRDLLTSITIPIFARHADELEHPSRERFLWLMAGEPWSPLRVIATAKHIALLDRSQDAGTQHIVCQITPRNQELVDALCGVERQRISRLEYVEIVDNLYAESGLAEV